MRDNKNLCEHLTISVAGITVTLSCDNVVNIDRLKGRYINFITEENPDLLVNTGIEDKVREHLSKNITTIFSRSGLNIYADTFRGSIDEKAGTARLFISDDQSDGDIEYFLRVVFAVLVFQKGGLMVHAAGLIHKDKAFIFMGHSGKGKSTLVGLSGIEKILSDDLVVIRPSSNTWIAYATPFWNLGDLIPEPHQAILQGLYTLRHAKISQLKSLDRGQGIAEIISNTPVLPDDPFCAGKLISTCDDLLKLVPAYQLDFAQDRSFLSLLRIDDQ